MALLDDIKKDLRITHTALDSEIDDIIEEARADLKLSGVSYVKVEAETNIDPLIKRAIKIYSKSRMEEDTDKADRFSKSYEMLKQHLSLAADYQEPAPVV